MESVAVIGTGIAGMSCARKLFGKVNLSLFEAELEPGGHTHTVDVQEQGADIPVDTGFMVYNEVTYPLLTLLFKELEVETYETDMSFGVQYTPQGLEYCGSNLNRLFAQRRNLLNPKFYGLIRDILRFNKLANAALADPQILDQTLESFAHEHRLGETFLKAYLVPMTSAIWSTPPGTMLQFPAHTLIRFMYNHGLLGVQTQHTWRTVKGGSRSYRDKLIKPFRDHIQCGRPVTEVIRHETNVEVRTADGDKQFFDKVVMATHADTTVRLLQNPTADEERVLSCFKYAANDITLHTDESIMPQNRRAWASWNYRMDTVEGDEEEASTHYWMNSLQDLAAEKNYFVSVNGAEGIREDSILRQFSFDHPIFDKPAVQAQEKLPRLNEAGKLYYCGSYFRYGFHEDGLMSGYAAAEMLLKHTRPHAKLAV
ncbi:MAG: NAD(P)/FAD-dependent oxidoreductase [Puniceicoccaceae bacterium]